MTDIDRIETIFSELCKIHREKMDSLATEKHNLTIDLIDAQKKRDQFREVLAAIVNSRHPDPDLTALARELVAPKPEPFDMARYAESVVMGGSR